MEHKDIKEGVIATHTESKMKIEIMRFKENSRTIVVVKDIDRGKGWCEEKQKYVGVFVPHGWYRGENHGYGMEHEVHINSIESIVLI